MGEIQMKVNTGSSVNVNKGQTAERTNNAPNQVSEQKKVLFKNLTALTLLLNL